jgi:hypothetical protein
MPTATQPFKRTPTAPSAVDSAAPTPIPDDVQHSIHKRTLAVLMAGHNLRRLNKMYQAFEGDLLLPIVLGEIGLHYLHTLIAETDATSDTARPATGATRSGAVYAYRSSKLGDATSLPRETARRKAMQLVALGWLRPVTPGTVALTERSFEHFGFDYNRETLDDFLWTAGRIREVLAFETIERRQVDLRAEFALALATRTEEHGARRFSTGFTPPPAKPGERLSEILLCVAATLVGYWVRHLHRIRVAFGGDLLLPLLLGEVAHYNIGSLMYRGDAGLATLDLLFTDAERSQHLLAEIFRPCNAHSLALVTGVPDSSVRRKLATLVERGWLAMLPDRTYFVTPRPAVEFESLNLATLRDFLETEARLRKLLSD